MNGSSTAATVVALIGTAVRGAAIAFARIGAAVGAAAVAAFARIGAAVPAPAVAG